MKIGSSESIRANKLKQAYIIENFSGILRGLYYENKKNYIEESASSSIELYHQYSNEDIYLPYIHLFDLENKYIIHDIEAVQSGKFDEWEEITIEDASSEYNTFALICKQKVYRNNSKKCGWLIGIIMSPSIDYNMVESDLELNNIFEYYDNAESEFTPVVIWTPTCESLYEIMCRDRDKIENCIKIIMEISENLEVDIYKLVEDIFNIKSEEHSMVSFERSVSMSKNGNMGFYYSVDIRVFFSIIKQIMICEDELYPLEKGGKGCKYFLEQFQIYIDSNFVSDKLKITREQIKEKNDNLDLGLIKDDSILGFEDLPEQ